MGFFLGLVGLGTHDAAAAIVDGNGQLIAAAEEERYTRIKFDPSFPVKSVAFCLKKAGITLNEVDRIGYYLRPQLHLLERAKFAAKNPAHLGGYLRKALKFRKFSSVTNVIRDTLNYQGHIDLIPHHLCHGTGVFFSSPFEQATLVSIDGVGEWETSWIGTGKGNVVDRLESVVWPDSLGEFYSAVTQFLGYKYDSDEYKVMGLAAYGKPTFAKEFEQLVHLSEDGRFKINRRFFDYPFGAATLFNRKEFERMFGPANPSIQPPSDRDKSFAASAQHRLEECFLEYVRRAVKLTGIRDVCLTGGVAMNCSAVGKVLASGIADRIFIGPASADDGCAIGAAYHLAATHSPTFSRSPLVSPYLGNSFTSAEIEHALNKKGLEYARHHDSIVQYTAGMIANGKVVGWFQGGTEFGQRALGARSILADPRRREMKEIINAKIKYREPYRPFAPSVLEERCEDYFHAYGNTSPYMTHVFRARDGIKDKIPAVVHVDGTSRVQTVSRRTHGIYYDLIAKVGEITRHPVILNTSFNVNGQPIVNTPEEAIECYLNTDIDALAIGTFTVEKSNLSKLQAPA